MPLLPVSNANSYAQAPCAHAAADPNPNSLAFPKSIGYSLADPNANSHSHSCTYTYTCTYTPAHSAAHGNACAQHNS